MAALVTEHVTDITHWNDRLFSFRTTRSDAFRFRNGHFVMLGVEVDGKPLLRIFNRQCQSRRAFGVLFNKSVQDGPLTSRLQHLQINDPVWVSKKPVGTLVTDDLNPGKRLILLSTGTGLAPFLSITRDPEVYERFDEVVLVHGVRQKNDLAYYDYFTQDLPNDEYMGELIKAQLTYLPTVTREPFERQGRITDLMTDGTLALDPASDRIMLCGSQSMLQDVSAALDGLGFVASPNQGTAGDYVIERAFVEQ